MVLVILSIVALVLGIVVAAVVGDWFWFVLILAVFFIIGALWASFIKEKINM